MEEKLTDKCKRLDNGNYECPYCGKELKPLGAASHIHRIHTEDGKNIKPNLGKSSWIKGLTKETDERVKKAAETYKRRLKSGKIKGNKGRKLSEEHKEKISKNIKNYIKNNGYNKGIGRGKSGWYKGYWCDSTWELAFVIYHLDHKIPFKRNTQGFEYIWNGEKHLYFPDFVYPDGTYVEVKGYYSEQTNGKIKQFKEKILIFDHKNIQNILYYCKLKCGDKLELLYDEKQKQKLNDTLKQLSKKNDKRIKGLWASENKRFNKRINIYEFRKQIYDEIEKKRGWIGKLAQQWGISHTQVRRWINKNI